ncbi:MAG TPA: heme exporter protein CcmD [Cellvibrionaceae bacterium]
MPDFKFTSLNDFLLMSGHGIYVWSSVAIALVILGALIVHPLLLHKRQIKQLKKRAAQTRAVTTNDSH